MVLGESLGVWAWGLFFCGMNGGRDERTGCQRGGCMVVPGAVVSPGGGEPSALRWMAAGAEFPCDVLGDGVASALRWMWVG